MRVGLVVDTLLAVSEKKTFKFNAQIQSLPGGDIGDTESAQGVETGVQSGALKR